jgi:Archaeal ADP-dependent phosphofructokinase/glucokinase
LDFTERYRSAADNLKTLGESCRKRGTYIAAGYTTNFDIVTDWRPQQIDGLIPAYLSRDKDYFSGEPSEINTPEEFIHSVISHMLRGMGGEVEIHNEGMCRFITDTFAHKSGLGGTCIQAAAALSMFHIPVVLHPTDCSDQILAQVVDKEIFFVDQGGLCRADNFPREKKTPPTPHFIFQFVKGDKLHIFGKTVEAARSNRLIVTYDMINQELPLLDEYFSYLERNAASFTSHIVSGLNCIMDENILNKRIERFNRHLSAFKKNNPSCVVYLEDAYYHRFEFKLAVYRSLLKSCDILGINEEELGELTGYFNIPTDFDDIVSIADALRFIVERFPMHYGIVLHTKDYALFYGDRTGMDIETGLSYANLLACTRANYGRYGDTSEVRRIAALPPCERGLAFVKNAREYGLGERMVIVPSIEIGVPKYTIGLGDTFVGGLQLCFCR